VIINVQGDEPLIDGTDLQKLSEFHINSNYNISTIVKSESMEDENFKSPDKVKAIFSKENGKCHFFTRSPVPFVRDDQDSTKFNEWFLHIGVYGYSPQSLLNYCLLKPTRYEELEKLEQLRAIENEMTIGAIITEHEMIGVDRPEDILKLEGVLSDK
jgi:3-deoxy-manno-octulosonate cytidylyltransferase (CMP-KDO synthetase)